MSPSSQLRWCELCHAPWKKGDAHDLRGFGWIDPLPRRITASNGDLLLHDGEHGRERFLLVEVKMPWEPPLQVGQHRLLRAAASQANWTVRLLWGRFSRVTMYRVGARAVESPGLLVRPAAFRSSVVDWLNGQPWADPRGVLEQDDPLDPEAREAAWAIVKDARGMNDTGHGAAVRWARAYLGLDDEAEAPPAARKSGGHMHGWARVDGEWACVQDYNAVGDAPETACGATWTAPVSA